VRGATFERSRPVIELHTSQPTPAIMRRLTRVMMDVVHLKELTAAEARALYDDLEATRDALSQILDRADGKD